MVSGYSFVFSRRSVELLKAFLLRRLSALFTQPQLGAEPSTVPLQPTNDATHAAPSLLGPAETDVDVGQLGELQAQAQAAVLPESDHCGHSRCGDGQIHQQSGEG